MEKQWQELLSLLGKWATITDKLYVLCAEKFDFHSAFVTIGDVNRVALETTVAELGKWVSCSACICESPILMASGRLSHGVVCDVTEWSQQVDLFEQAIEKSPSKVIDIVVANAGLGAGAGDPFATLDEQGKATSS